MVYIYCKNNDAEKEIADDLPLSQIAENEQITLPYPILGALVNNKVQTLNFKISKSSIISFFDATSKYGRNMYNLSAYFLLFKAVSDVLPEAELHILHSISGGKYCELEKLNEPLTESMVQKIQRRMEELVAQDLPFERVEMLTEKALDEYARHGLTDKAEIFKYRKRIFTSIYKLDDKINYYYGFLLPSTGYIKTFALALYENGILLRLPSRKNPTELPPIQKLPKLFAVYKQYKEWCELLKVPHIYHINEATVTGEIGDLIKISEALHEKLLAQIADEINHRQKVKMVLISGPSSSGKTTTCKRLSIQLSILGYHPIPISTDDFFIEREDTPLDENGEYDFEAFETLDLQLFNKTIRQLLSGETVSMPTFNFTTGKKEWRGNYLKMQENSILVIEGIHCLNPRLTEQFDDSCKYKLFVSALTSVSIDNQNPIPTTDNRLLRRIIRDYQYRNYSATATIKRWNSVRIGEEKHIFPYQENADCMFNSSLVCELGVLKPYALEILKEVPETAEEYAEAVRLIKFLKYFKTIPEKDVPSTSILREFVGGSNFHY